MRPLALLAVVGCAGGQRVAYSPRRANHPYLEGYGWHGNGNTSTTAGRLSAGYVGRVCSCVGEFELRGGALVELGQRKLSDGVSTSGDGNVGGEIEADADVTPDLRLGPRLSFAAGVAPETGFVMTAGVHMRSDHFDLGAELMHDTGADGAPSTTELGLGVGVSANSVAGVTGGVVLSLLAVAIAASLPHDN